MSMMPCSPKSPFYKPIQDVDLKWILLKTTILLVIISAKKGVEQIAHTGDKLVLDVMKNSRVTLWLNAGFCLKSCHPSVYQVTDFAAFSENQKFHLCVQYLPCDTI